MKFLVRNTPVLKGDVYVPGNKSGTARAIILGSLANGQTRIHNPLLNLDSFSIINMFRAMGVSINTENPKEWTIEGCGGNLTVPSCVLDAENSGTGYYMITAVSSLLDGQAIVSGDYQICYRPAGPLIEALNQLGANVSSTRENGLAPLVVKGIIKGGEVVMPGINSQWVTPIMVAGPLAENDTRITINDDAMTEIPYINMTMGMLKQVGVEIEHSDDYLSYYIKGGQNFQATEFHIPADWGSSGYPLVASALIDSDVTFHNLNLEDYAGETAFVDILEKMGADIEIKNNGLGGIRLRGGKPLKGIEIDCSGTPDATPILAVLGCKAEGKTVLTNVAGSRLKETDRAAIITKELKKMGAKIEETHNTLTIYNSKLNGAFIDSHHDHRIVMAISVASLIADSPTLIDYAEVSDVSYPKFYDAMKGIGADITRLNEA